MNEPASHGGASPPGLGDRVILLSAIGRSPGTLGTVIDTDPYEDREAVVEVLHEDGTRRWHRLPALRALGMTISRETLAMDLDDLLGPDAPAWVRAWQTAHATEAYAYSSDVDVAYVQQVVEDYLAQLPDERAVLEPLLDALASPDAASDLNSRASSGHLTAGAILVDPDTRTVLQLHHVKLGRWLYPGGHVEAADTSLSEAARRELIEEAGPEFGEALLLDEAPVEIDVHAIPARPDGSEPGHLHFDFRFAFMAVGGDPELQLEEVSSHRWTPLDSLGEVGRRVDGLLAQDPR